MPAEMTTSGVFQPTVEWAQRKDVIFVTVTVENSKTPQIDLADDKFHFRGRGGPDQREYECILEFYKPVDSGKARRIPSDRNIQYVIPKKEIGPFWPRLLKTDKKMHWVKIDFNKWKDEDDLSDEEAAGGGKFDLNDMMGQMGGFGGEKPDLDDLEDSDNEDLPDLEDDKEKEEEGGEGKKEHAADTTEKEKEAQGDHEDAKASIS